MKADELSQVRLHAPALLFRSACCMHMLDQQSDRTTTLHGSLSATALQKRMPSRLTGTKSEVFEGGVRNFLAVQGPGVQAGVTDSTLLEVTGARVGDTV